MAALERHIVTDRHAAASGPMSAWHGRYHHQRVWGGIVLYRISHDILNLPAQVIAVICVLVWVMNVNRFSDPALGGWFKGAIYYFKVIDHTICFVQ
jgi:hypothetical protein